MLIQDTSRYLNGSYTLHVYVLHRVSTRKSIARAKLVWATIAGK